MFCHFQGKWIDQPVHMSLIVQDEIVNVSPAITNLNKYIDSKIQS